MGVMQIIRLRSGGDGAGFKAQVHFLLIIKKFKAYTQ